MKSKKKFLIGLLIICGAIIAFLLLSQDGNSNYKDKYADAGDLNVDVEGIGRDHTYAKYLRTHEDANFPEKEITVDLSMFRNSYGIELLDGYAGENDVLATDEDSYGEWAIEVPESGMYQVYMEYYSVKARGVDIERKFYINGEIPFVGADTLKFTRLWANKTEIVRDNQGNDIRPSQVDVPEWIGRYFKDDLGYFTKPYTFYLEKGTNIIGLEAVNEPAIIKSLTFHPVKEDLTYQEYKESVSMDISNDRADFIEVVQGEASTVRSSPSLYATYDRSSSNTEPRSISEVRLNMIGGTAWKIPGQWIEWEVEVPEDGLYHLTLKARQNYNRGFVSNRSVLIDGEIPFAELSYIQFQYDNNWKSVTLSDEENNPYDIYLSKGKHTIRLEVTLGELGNILNDMQDAVYRLNEIYRKILVLTGTAPDKYRDYRIAKVYPEVIEAMDLESKRIYKMMDDIIAYSGEKTNQVATLQTMAEQLDKFVANPDNITKSFGNFKDNISALGTTILTLSEAPLDIDYITVTSGTERPAEIKENFIDRFVHEAKSFFASFTEDYNAVGDVYDKEEAIQVWILSGRDQSTILKTMIDDTFTPNSGIYVNVKLVEGSSLLNAIVAGKGPDVVLSAGQGDPVNYALRNAVENLAQFEDYEAVLENFYPSAYTPYQLNGGVYGLPETQNFNVLFYRKDILEELKLELPQTWDELIAMLPVIQQNNMSVAIPSTERTMNNVSNSDLSSYFALLYQYGGTVYADDGKSTVIGSESGVAAFETYAKLFAQYKLPTTYDFPNQFRSGMMPIGIADYSTFNTLVVFAPEIRGLWDFTAMPGMLRADGTIDRSCHTSTSSCFMLAQGNNQKKQNAWEFLKWWVSTETQIRFGREMESIMGASARYATANKNAFEQLSWSSNQLEVLKEQWQWTVGLREIPGGYYTGRHITNAIRTVITNNEDPRETLLDYSRTINEEIRKKRLEFGLDSK